MSKCPLPTAVWRGGLFHLCVSLLLFLYGTIFFNFCSKQLNNCQKATCTSSVQQQYPEVCGLIFSTIFPALSVDEMRPHQLYPNGVAVSLRTSHPSIPSGWCWFEARDVLGMICVGAIQGFRVHSALTKKLPSCLAEGTLSWWSWGSGILPSPEFH